MLASTSAAAASAPPAAAQIEEEKIAPAKENDEAAGRSEQNYSKKRVGEGDIKLDNARLAKAIEEEKKRKMRGEPDDERLSFKKKKGVPDSGSHDVTEEELGTLLHAYGVFFAFTHFKPRGLPDDPSPNGGSYGQLRRHGRLITLTIVLLYANTALCT